MFPPDLTQRARFSPNIPQVDPAVYVQYGLEFPNACVRWDIQFWKYVHGQHVEPLAALIAFARTIPEFDVRARVNSPSTKGEFPVHVSFLRRDDVSCLKALVEAGADPNAVSARMGSTPLHYGAFQGRIVIVEYLLSRNDIHVLAEDALGYTPLEIARRYGRNRVVEVLQPVTVHSARLSVAYCFLRAWSLCSFRFSLLDSCGSGGNPG
jgi:hypothetical protein